MFQARLILQLFCLCRYAYFDYLIQEDGHENLTAEKALEALEAYEQYNASGEVGTETKPQAEPEGETNAAASEKASGQQISNPEEMSISAADGGNVEEI